MCEPTLCSVPGIQPNTWTLSPVKQGYLSSQVDSSMIMELRCVSSQYTVRWKLIARGKELEGVTGHWL